MAEGEVTLAVFVPAGEPFSALFDQAAAVPAPFWGFVLRPAEVLSVREPRSQQPHEDRARHPNQREKPYGA